MNEIWFYHLEVEDSNSLMSFCEAAYQKEFLRKFEQKVTRYYRCQARDCNDCYENGTWELYNTTYGEIREVL